MKKTDQNRDLLNEEQKRNAVRAIIDFYTTERDEEIGVIAAEEILDVVLQTAGDFIYNRGVKDGIKVMKERFEGTEVDMRALLRDE